MPRTSRQFVFILTAFCLLSAPVIQGESEQNPRLLQTTYFIPVHLNGTDQEYTLVTTSPKVVTAALIGGKYVALPLLAACVGAACAGRQVNWEVLGQLSLGFTAIVGAQMLAISALNEPILVPMSAEELRSKFKENKRYDPPYYFLDGLKFKDNRFLVQIIKGRSVQLPNKDDKVIVDRLNLDGDYITDKKGKSRFRVSDIQGFVTKNQETVPLMNASCGGILRRILSLFW